jgi:hypothetical protein
MDNPMIRLVMPEVGLHQFLAFHWQVAELLLLLIEQLAVLLAQLLVDG